MARLAAPTSALAVLVIGCATAPPWEIMVADRVEAQHQNPYRVRVESAGLRDTEKGALISSVGVVALISRPDFHAALVESLVRSRVFSEVVLEGRADYLLDVFIHVGQPMVGVNVTVGAAAKWTLTELATRKILFEEIVRTSYTARGEDERNRTRRIRLAHEGAVRNNIAEGIRKLSSLDRSDAQVTPAAARAQ